mmetsp:Transcript_17043/g.42598  ORF Transcript_17043/g.42598 Transcript_17043/m.42598 type:complete len:133 (+) Transcript_17043:114-512(+)|eukprot:CAMPEP_0116103346 /NCGR_PEP_ID=MMETSP0327-20121206/13833_1 /TAXON_ID=44447 /ORGANISM="Pseudo-nitzschia delicatissima, Strain B596" /LENGTH=132 /DNA_ID=CAMNT_0003595445 /DNA_START=56 /DNA_END=454 /DNA_ORIENTATION=-
MTRLTALNIAFLLFNLQCSLVAADTRLHRRDDVTGHIPSTHEEIVSRREEHHDVFSTRLADVNRKLDQHSSGEQLLTEPEFNRLNRKKKAFESKLEELGREFDERHSSRIIWREELLNDMTKSRIGRAREEL